MRKSLNPSENQVFLPQNDWRSHAGCLHGVRERTLTGSVSIAALPAASLAGLATHLEQVWDELAIPVATASERETGAAMAEHLARAVIAIQVLNHIPLGDWFSVRASGPAADGRESFHLALPSQSPQSSKLALDWAISALNRLLRQSAGDDAVAAVRSTLAEINLRLRHHAPGGSNTFHFVRAAHRRAIPVTRVFGDYFSFGTGCHSRLLQSTFTDRTSAIGTNIAGNKAITATFLRSRGMPAPSQNVVQTVPEALGAAQKIGFPVVVKPIDEEQGRGVSAFLTDDAAVREAAAAALKLSQRIIVEPHVAGNDYRLTVCDGELMKVEMRLAASVTGDGTQTIAQLIDEKQASAHYQRRFRRTGEAIYKIDAEVLRVLKEAGLNAEAVPAAGQRIALRHNRNITTGGEQVGISPGDVHPDNVSLAIRAAKLLCLDLAGVDLLIEDITRSWLETGAAICEVNAQPQIGVRTSPEIYGDILSRLQGGNSRIPAHLVLTGDTQAPFRDCCELAAKLGCNGAASAAGLWIDGAVVPAQPQPAFAAARTLLSDKEVTGALCVMPLAEVIRDGLPCDRFDTIRFDGCKAEPAVLDSLRPHADELLLP